MSDPWTLRRPGHRPGPGRAGWSPWSTSPPSPSAAATGDIVTPARPRACSSGTPGSCPASSCGSTGPGPSAGRRSPTIPSRPPSCPGACPARAGRLHARWCSARRYVGQGMREDLVIRNFGDEPTFCSVELFVDADFADLFAVKEGRVGDVRRRDHHGEQPATDQLDVLPTGGARSTAGWSSTSPRPPAVVADDLVSFEAIVPAHGRVDGLPRGPPGHRGEGRRPPLPVRPAGRPGRPGRAAGQVAPPGAPGRDRPRRACGRWSPAAPRTSGRCGSSTPTTPSGWWWRPGRPWFMTVFGRDSLITSWMALLVDPDLALGVLQTLARFQGKDIDPRNDEEPGRILHEMRFGDAAVAVARRREHLLRDRRRHAAVRDAARRAAPLGSGPRGGGRAPAQRRAGASSGSRSSATPTATATSSTSGPPTGGSPTRGGRTAGTASATPTARVAQAPIALCEVQAYVYGAYLARAHFAFEAGDDATYDRFRAKATQLKTDVQPGLLARGPGVVRRRPRRRQAAHRLADLQHRPLPVDRHRRRGQGPRSSPTS